jgi:CheY-like chemotaxis protein
MAASQRTLLEGITVLVVDDEPEVLDLLAETLERYGAKTFRVGGGEEAVQFLESERVDLVLSDIRMPKGDGVYLLDKVAPRPESPPVILMTGYSDLTEAEALKRGAKALITKPFDFVGLVKYVAKYARPELK